MAASEDIRKKKGSVPTLVKVVGAAAIVALFSCLYSISFWDPVGSMKNVEIAIANNDKGVYVDGEHVNMGDSIVSELMENDAVKWVELDSGLTAEEFGASGYLMAFEIPEDFSQKAYAGQEGSPQAAELVVYKNMRQNYLFTQFSGKIVSMVQDSIDGGITSSYVGGTFEALSAAQEGFESAGEGAAALAEGGAALAEGAGRLGDGTEQLAAGASQVETGAGALVQGSGQLASGASALSAGAGELAARTTGMGAQSQALAGGVAQTASGIEGAVDATDRLIAGAGTITGGLQALQSGTDGAGGLVGATAAVGSLEGGMGAAVGALGSREDASTLIGGSATAGSMADAASAALQNIDYSDPAAVAQAVATAQQYLSGASQTSAAVTGGLEQMQGQLGTAQAGASQTRAGLQTAVDSLGSVDNPATLIGGATSLQSGLVALRGDGESGLSYASSALGQIKSAVEASASNMGQLEAGVANVAQGAAAVDSGAAALSSGAGGLAEATAALAAGSADAAAGAAGLEAGTQQGASGSNALAAALADGSAQFGGDLAARGEEMSAYLAQPTEVVENDYGYIAYYGQAFSAFFMTTALWLGALMVFFILDPFYPVRVHAGRVRTVLGRLPLYGGVCALEALAVVAVAFAIGVPQNAQIGFAEFFLFAICVSVGFMLIMQLLNMVFGIVGKAMAVVLLIIQLVAAGGTMPVELGPSFLAAIKPWIPFTYSIDGFRELISTGSLSVATADALCVLLFGAVCLTLTFVLFGFAKKNRARENGETLARISDGESSVQGGRQDAMCDTVGAALRSAFDGKQHANFGKQRI